MGAGASDGGLSLQTSRSLPLPPRSGRPRACAGDRLGLRVPAPRRRLAGRETRSLSAGPLGLPDPVRRALDAARTAGFTEAEWEARDEGRAADPALADE